MNILKGRIITFILITIALSSMATLAKAVIDMPIGKTITTQTNS